MITRITGKLRSVADDVAVLSVAAFDYEVLIPEFARRRLQARLGEDVSLFTIDYLEGNPMQGRLTPRLVGFLSEVEREFFELFCSVDGVGVKKALRAMVRPVPEVAEGIEEQDLKLLASLPGVGPATAERIVAKLRRKMPKFALLVARDEPTLADVDRDVISETFDALRALGHSESESRRLIDAVLGQKKKFASSEHLLQAIYERRRQGNE